MDDRVLSIQSHVVSGYVGNKSVVFPLQVLGFEVDFVNSVQFSNHTWYKVFKGQVLNANDLDELYLGLKENNLNRYTHLLTGYIGSESFLHKVCDIAKDLKQLNPCLLFVCDPVMGDDGTWYVPKELLPIYREEVLPLADVILPNSWEAEQLTGEKIESEADVKKVTTSLHSKGPKVVVLSSTNVSGSSQDSLVGYCSLQFEGVQKCYRMETPRLPAMFIGTGDLFAALFLAWSHKHPDDLGKVCGYVQSTMAAVLERTLKSAQAAAGGEKPSWAQLELKLIQSKADIELPPARNVTVTELQW